MSKSKEELKKEILEHEKIRKEKELVEKKTYLTKLKNEYKELEKEYDEIKKKHDKYIPLRFITRNKIHFELAEIKRKMAELNARILFIEENI